MSKIAAGSGLIVSGVVRMADAMASIVASVPTTTLVPSKKPLNKTDARRKIARLKASFCPRKIQLGDFTQDFHVLCHDARTLEKDMREAERKLTDIK
jgi:hypothetical protein